MLFHGLLIMKKRLMEFRRIILLGLFVLAIQISAVAQTDDSKQRWHAQIDTNCVNILKPDYLQVEQDIVLEQFNKQPNFGMYRDNYFITGIPTNKKITNHTADAKFQISIRQRLLKGVLPFNSFLMLSYTQKSFWNIYEESAPFGDNNYNPGLMLVNPIVRDNKLWGIGTFGFEHESNGRDSLDSRSWNYFTLSGVYFYNVCFSIQAKIWYGWIDGENRDLFEYKGYGLLALNYKSLDDKFGASIVVNPCKKAINTQLELTFQPNKRANQYLFVQWYQGYGESLLDYNQYTSMIRFGICIRPSMRNLY